MDAVKYFKTIDRICNKHEDDCQRCYLWGKCPICGELGEVEKSVAAVEKWSVENPIVTNGDKIWEMIPSDMRSTTAKSADSEVFDMNMITAKDHIELRIVKDWWDAEYKERRTDG